MLFVFYIAFLTKFVSSENESQFSASIVKEAQDVDTNKCICINSFHHTVPDGMNHGKDLERIVVYFYKNKVTNEIFMYTPKQEVQYVFPDLSIQYGDLMVIMSKTSIAQALDSNENFIPLKSHNHHHTGSTLSETEADSDTDSVPITGNMKKVQSPIENEQKYNDYSFDEDNEQDFLTQAMNEITLKQEHSQYPLSEINSLPVNERVLSEHKSKDTNGVIKNCSPLNKDCSKKDKNVLSVENLVLDYPSNFKTESVKEINYPYNQDTHTHGRKHSGHRKNDSKTKLNIGDIFDPLASLYGIHTNFDNWFDQQIHFLNYNYKLLDSGYDLEFLKYIIRNILYDNLIKIKDGILYNNDGVPINAANLRLRLISIENIDLYKNLLNMKDISSLLPRNLQNFDAIVVIQTLPPKLLGIVPLRKTCKANTSYRRMYHNPAYNPMRWPSNHVGNNPYYPSHLYNPYMYNRRSAAIPNDYPIYWYETEKRNNKRKDSSLFGKYLKKPFDALKSILDLRVGQDSLPGTVIDLLSSAEINSNDVTNEEDYETYDDIGIRIIGGNPATSSGTPINNKGRSADNTFK